MEHNEDTGKCEHCWNTVRTAITFLCQSCSGNSWITLQSCSGNGWITLQSCSGNKRITPQPCSGNSYITLQSCSGNSRITIQSCSGNSRIRLQSYTRVPSKRHNIREVGKCTILYFFLHQKLFPKTKNKQTKSSEYPILSTLLTTTAVV